MYGSERFILKRIESFTLNGLMKFLVHAFNGELSIISFSDLFLKTFNFVNSVNPANSVHLGAIWIDILKFSLVQFGL